MAAETHGTDWEGLKLVFACIVPQSENQLNREQTLIWDLCS